MTGSGPTSTAPDPPQNPVGVSLLAIAVYQPPLMLTDKTLSRAGSLLQFGFAVLLRSRPRPDPSQSK
ncbi:hypothetical protein PkoCFBP13504_21195 [Pseudomonas koreensis]|nr:hypothetical protein PkoCFBP13504_21195 [Pseudomonas koreensis]